MTNKKAKQQNKKKHCVLYYSLSPFFRFYEINCKINICGSAHAIQLGNWGIDSANEKQNQKKKN